MQPGRAPILILLALLAMVCSGLQTAFAESAHAEHGGWHYPDGQDDGSPDEADSDHCSHLTGHLIGLVSDAGRPAFSRAAEPGGSPSVLLLGARAPPPTPPPNS